MKPIAWMAVLVLCVATPAWGGRFDSGDTLKPDEGIVLTNMTCGGPVVGVQLYAEGVSSGGFFGVLKSDGAIGCKAGVWTIRMKAGRYYVGMLYSGTDELAIPPEKAPHFTVEAGKVNYIGDIYAGQPISAPLDEETAMRVLGGVLNVLNHEPQMRELLGQPEHAWMSRYPFVADGGLGPHVPVSAALTPDHRQMQVTMRISKPRWKRGADGQPVVCPRLVPLPKGTKPVAGEVRPCDGDFVTPEQLLVADYGASAKVRRVEALDGEEGPLTIAATAIPPGLKDRVRRQLDVPAGHWSDGRLGQRVCFDSATTQSVDLAGTANGACPSKAISPREYLRLKLGREARFVNSVAVADNGLLRIDYDIDVPAQ